MITASDLIERLKRYGWNVLVAVDQLFNAMLAGYPDETFSARTYRKAVAGQWFWKGLRWSVDHLFFWRADHCRESYESELERTVQNSIMLSETGTIHLRSFKHDGK